MELKNLETWEQFKEELQKLEEWRSQAQRSTGEHFSNFLFRGQKNCSWHLETTLEKRIGKPINFESYFRLVSSINPQIETFTDQRFDFPPIEDIIKWASDLNKVRTEQFPAYDYLAYLRHHRFPSPLLDWTESPYVAAFFAFEAARPERIAIFAFLEYGGQGKHVNSRDPFILSFGPYVRTHRRHFLQQSNYTLCAQFKNKEAHFAHHEDVFEKGEISQDKLWKFTIPADERLKVLRELYAHNINAFSLFQTEESLLETIALREIDLQNRIG